MRKSEAGFALLFVYAMAATIAIMLFLELPRVAFEAQREKEQLLIDRGEQYSRAITLFVRKFNRYPADFEALENTQNLRFLRRRYVDPITGKEEWRLIHVGPGGVFIDSLVYNKKKDDSTKSAPQNFITETQQTGGNQVEASQGVNLAERLRPSDQPGAPGDPGNPQNAMPQMAPAQPGQFGFNQPGLNQPGFNQPGLNQPGLSQPGLTQPGLPQFDANGQLIPNTGQTQPGMAGFPPGVQLPPGLQSPPGMQLPLPPGANQQGQVPTVAPAGANLINQLLTTPRPGGLNGMNGQQPNIDQYGIPAPGNTLTAGNTGQGNTLAAGNTSAGVGSTSAPTGQTIGGGIAGVASKREQEGIKLYGKRSKYNEWEFVYDVTKDKTRGGGVTIPQPPGTTTAGQAQPPAAAPAQPQQAQQQLLQFQQQQFQQQQQQPVLPGQPPPPPPPGPPPIPSQ